MKNQLRRAEYQNSTLGYKCVQVILLTQKVLLKVVSELRNGIGSKISLLIAQDEGKLHTLRRLTVDHPTSRRRRSPSVPVVVVRSPSVCRSRAHFSDRYYITSTRRRHNSSARPIWVPVGWVLRGWSEVVVRLAGRGSGQGKKTTRATHTPPRPRVHSRRTNVYIARNLSLP